jgi:hypothetical protein
MVVTYKCVLLMLCVIELPAQMVWLKILAGH